MIIVCISAFVAPCAFCPAPVLSPFSLPCQNSSMLCALSSVPIPPSLPLSLSPSLPPLNPQHPAALFEHDIYRDTSLVDPVEVFSEVVGHDAVGIDQCGGSIKVAITL